MDSMKFYCNNKPKEGEIVQVVFTNRIDDHTEGYLTEYPGNIIMVHSQATKKKKIKSYNKVIPLNKPVPAVIENFDDNGNGSVSRAYLEDSDENYTGKFLSNTRLFNGIGQICKKFGLNFEEFWSQKLFPFLESNNKEDNLYLETLIKNIPKLNQVTDNSEIIEEVKQKFINVTIKKEIFRREIGIVSNEGVELIKELIKQTISDFNSDSSGNISIKYKNTPHYVVESDSSESHLANFIKLMVENSKKKSNIFIKHDL